MESENNNAIASNVLVNYQKKYPNLKDFIYDANTDTLQYNGNFIKLNGYGLSRIDEIFFNLNPDDIFLYIKNGFYYNLDESRYMNSLFEQFIITEEEVTFVESYVQKLALKFQMYEHNKYFFDNNINNDKIKNFLDETNKGLKVINKVKNHEYTNDSVSEIFTKAYQKYFPTSINTIAEEKSLTLTRTNPNFKGDLEFSENERYLQELKKRDQLSIAGYSTFLLVILSTITFGIILALQILK